MLILKLVCIITIPPYLVNCLLEKNFFLNVFRKYELSWKLNWYDQFCLTREGNIEYPGGTFVIFIDYYF